MTLRTPWFKFAVHPVLVLLVAMISIQSGATLAKSLFPVVGPAGASALRLFFAAVILLAVMRPWRQGPIFGPGFPQILHYGLALGGLNLLFYLSLKTLPIGIAVALEFTGPLAVALFGSRRPRDFLWVGLAMLGILLLLPIGQASAEIDPMGAMFALAAGACWAAYIVFGQKAGTDHGTRSVALGTAVAAALVIPAGVVDAGAALFTPALIPVAIAVAILSTALPYTLEMMALTRMPTRVFGTLMSVEPAIAALAGFAFLGEMLTGMQMLAILAIVIASLGSAATMPPTGDAKPA